ncbi:MAG: hypothetical protein ABR562_04045 [Thermoplasmatota archaeon]
MRIVKKTLKGDLLGKTGFKKVGAGRGRAPDAPEGIGPSAVVPPPSPEAKGLEKPRGQARLGDVAGHDDLVIVTEPLHPRHGKPIPADALPPATPRTMSPEERQAAAEAEADLAAAQLGVTESRGGRRGNVAQVKDGGVAVHVPPAPVPAKNAAAPAKPAVLRAPMPNGMRLESDAVTLARSVIAEALFRDFGAPGTKMQHPRGGSFQVQSRFGEGVMRTQHDLLIPLPAGHVVQHTADLVVELDPRGLLVLDIVPSHVPLTDLKARAYDALQLRRIDRCFSVFVYIRAPGLGMAQGQAEAIAHGYDFSVGVDEEHVHSEAKFQALRTRVTAWLEAASAANRGGR